MSIIPTFYRLSKWSREAEIAPNMQRSSPGSTRHIAGSEMRPGLRRGAQRGGAVVEGSRGDFLSSGVEHKLWGGA